MTSFTPFPFLKNPHAQTLLAAYFGPIKDPPSITHYVSLPDQDQLALEISTPVNWKSSDPSAVMVHGLSGSHRSSYLQRLTHKLVKRGTRAIRVNLRGCGSGEGLAKKGYHAGQSPDLFEVLRYLKEKEPQTPTTLIGFSLGGNIVLKLASECSDLDRYIHKVIGICPAITLKETALAFNHWPNRYYERSFLKHLNKIAKGKRQQFSSDLKKALSQCHSLYEFDEKFTAPFWGFSSAHDYYTKCSAQPFIPQIKLPCQILFAEDDPLINAHALSQHKLPSHIELLITKHGGHMGFLGDPYKGPFRWMDELILNWSKLK